MLHLAAAYNNVTAITELVRPFYGLDINATDAAGWSPLHVAANNGRSSKATVARLLELGADTRQRSIPTAAGSVPDSLKGKAVTPLGAAIGRSQEAYHEYKSALSDAGLPCDEDEGAGLEDNDVFWDAPETL